MHLFFGEKTTSSQVSLACEEIHHLFKVLRLTLGEYILLTNGLGDLWKARLSKISKDKVEAEVVEHFPEYGKPSHHLHIALALPKSTDRFEWFLEKATELGVSEITPILSKRSLRTRFHRERSIKIIHSAVKQSIRAYIPIINPMVSYDRFLSGIPLGSQGCFIAHCQEKIPRFSLKNILNPSIRNYTLLIGPEGDFSLEEIHEALDKNWKGISLGTFRLRVETAALSALHAIQVLTDQN